MTFSRGAARIFRKALRRRGAPPLYVVEEACLSAAARKASIWRAKYGFKNASKPELPLERRLAPDERLPMRWQTLSEARWILLVLLLLAVAAWFLSPWLSLFFVLLILYTFAFFRDPERTGPGDPDAVVAAADGVVADIKDVEETEVLKRPARRVGIFLSVFDVHTNRAPVDGRVTYRQHRKGLCLDARSADCAEKNEAMTWAFENPRATIVVRQLTGAIARRIVGWAQLGDSLARGERFGMIRFGSRTEVYLPLDAEVLVKVGDRVVGGLSVIARLR
jgi:phosphatidylserine decarboxylase